MKSILILQNKEQNLKFKNKWNILINFNFDIFEITVSNLFEFDFNVYKSSFDLKYFSKIQSKGGFRDEEIFEFMIDDIKKEQIELKKNINNKTIVLKFSNGIILNLTGKEKNLDELRKPLINLIKN